MTSVYLAVVGPTAAGKTDLGLRLAQEQNGEIISVDSRQVYKYLSVGTAKPSDTGKISYHLIDFLEPDHSYSAADFIRDATLLINDIESRGKKPIFVGGTGLYFKALTEGLASFPPANPAVRVRLQKEAAEKGRTALHGKLALIDPVAAQKIPANNIQRLIRALEVYEVSGKPISQWHQEHQKSGVTLQFMGVDPGREELQRRIEARCRQMINNGMIEETRELLAKGFSESCPALSGLGYPRVVSYLKGLSSKDECLKLLIQDTRQYAKRQRTWFRNQCEVEWKK